MTQEENRLQEARTGTSNWRKWGPYLRERQWVTGHEDQSHDRNTCLRTLARLVMLCITLPSLVASAQVEHIQQPAQSVKPVTVLLNIRDTSGLSGPAVTKEDIVMTVNNQPVTVTELRSPMDTPLRMAILIGGGGMTRNYKSEQQVAIDFLSQMLRKDVDSAFFVGVDAEISATDWSNNIEQLTASVKKFQPVHGFALYDGLKYALDRLSLIARDIPARRVLVLFMNPAFNGIWPESNVHREDQESTLRNAILAAQRAGVTVYAVSTIRDSGHGAPGADLMHRLADDTGGLAVFTWPSLPELRKDFDHQYLAQISGIEATGKGKLKVDIRNAQNRTLKIRSTKNL
jgi:hypothetical protein